MTISNNRNLTFPLVIKFNAWLILFVWPGIYIIGLLLAIFLNNEEYTRLIQNQIFDKTTPILSTLVIIEMIIMYIAIWIMYVKKQYVKYIVSAFYLDYFFNVLINIPNLLDNFIPISIGLAILGLPILWLYMSDNVKEFTFLKFQ